MGLASVAGQSAAGSDLLIFITPVDEEPQQHVVFSVANGADALVHANRPTIPANRFEVQRRMVGIAMKELKFVPGERLKVWR